MDIHVTIHLLNEECLEVVQMNCISNGPERCIEPHMVAHLQVFNRVGISFKASLRKCNTKVCTLVTIRWVHSYKKIGLVESQAIRIVII